MHIVAFILGMLLTLIGNGKAASHDVTVIPPMPQYDASELFEECLCDECCYEKAYEDYAAEFTALFESYQVKRAKNGALMIRSGNAGSYRFAKKG